MGRICIQLDDKYEQFIRQDAVQKGLSLSEYIRQKMLTSTNTARENILPEEFLSLKAEIVQLRKEFRIVTGGLVEIMRANGLSIDEMKQAGYSFLKGVG